MPKYFAERGTRAFFIIWTGQLLSIVGSGMTSFVLGIWTFKRHGSTGQFATIVLAATLPGILTAPFAGVLVDRWNKKYTMLGSVAGMCLSTVMLAYLFSTNRIDSYWQVYPAIVVIAICGAFQWPALSAACKALLPEEMFSQAGALWQLHQAATMILSPLLAAAVFPYVRIEGVIAFDAASYIFAVTSLLIVHVPENALSGACESVSRGEKVREFFQEIADGWNYILTRRTLVALLLYSLFVNLVYDVVQILVMPLAVNGGSDKRLAGIMASSAAGMVIGSIVMAVWPGPKRRLWGVLGSGVLVGVALLAAGLQTHAALLAACFFFFTLFIPLGQSSQSAIWLKNTSDEYIGRVTSTNGMLVQLCFPIGCALAPLLADHIFAAVPIASALGNNNRGGVGLALSFLGLITAMVSIVLISSKTLRSVDRDPANPAVDILVDGEKSQPALVALSTDAAK